MMVYQVILINLWQIVSEALTRENKFQFFVFFAIYQIVPLENEGYRSKARAI